ncbi:MAG TPA: DMT family transporter [Rectinemataceae bacterium]|nr:DMT family transporter [Rectinemataceae bacterium]
MSPRRLPLRVRGFAALYSAATIFAFTSLFVKLSSRFYSGIFISGVRFAIGGALCLALLFARYGGVKPRRPGVLALRGLFGAGSMAATYAAISLTGPGRAALLSNMYPLFVPVFGALFFKERFNPRTLASLVLCTIGAVLVVRDGSGAALSGDLLAIFSAVLAGVAVNFVRKATSTENPFLIYLSPCLFGLPVLLFAQGPATTVTPLSLLFLLGVGGGAFVAQALMAYGYRSVPAGRGSVVFYWETALTVLLGFLLAGERFNLRFGLGLAFILGGLWLNRERRSERSGEGGGSSESSSYQARAAQPVPGEQAAGNRRR